MKNNDHQNGNIDEPNGVVQEKEFDYGFQRTFETDPNQYYKLEEQLGKGNQGVVYRYSKGGKQQAIKSVRKDKLKATRDIRMSEIEVYCLRQLHKCKQNQAPQLHSIIKNLGDQQHFVLDFIEGVDCTLIKFPDVQTLRLLLQNIASALRSLHSLGIVHRDVKPENILVDYQMNVTLIDQGSSKTLDYEEHKKFINQIDRKQGEDDVSITKSCTLVGSHQQVAPEVIKGKSVCYKCDSWSLACIVYRLLQGRLPFRSDNQSALQTAIESGNFDAQGLSSAQFEVQSKMFQVEPANRMSIDDIIQNLDVLMDYQENNVVQSNGKD